MTLKHSYLLDPDIIFLNHGSYGAVPRPVFDTYQYWQRHIESQPVAFFQREADRLLEKAREKLGAYLHTEKDNLVFVTNATYGVNVLARSLNLGQGDAILTSNAEYGALVRAWRFMAQQSGFEIHQQSLSLPLTTPEAFVDHFLNGIRPNTKLVYLSHIPSALSAILPVGAICRLCREMGILTLIDGAHAPGHIPLDLQTLNADFYIGNLHKWLCAPRGAAFIYAQPARQHLVKPLVVSWGWEALNPGTSQFIDWHQYTGTRDLSAFLSVPAAIAFQERHAWPEIQAGCHRLAAKALSEISRITGLSPFYAVDSDWYHQMVSIPLPKRLDPDQLHQTLLENGVEVVITQWAGNCILRVSVQAYNTDNEITTLINIIKESI